MNVLQKARFALGFYRIERRDLHSRESFSRFQRLPAVKNCAQTKKDAHSGLLNANIFEDRIRKRTTSVFFEVRTYRTQKVL